MHVVHTMDPLWSLAPLVLHWIESGHHHPLGVVDGGRTVRVVPAPSTLTEYLI